MNLTFEWDAEKAETNLSKHGIRFEEAKNVFRDPLSVTISDQRGHAEDRFVDIGRSATGRILVVVYTERDHNIRIISARTATASERRTYEQKSH